MLLFKILKIYLYFSPKPRIMLLQSLWSISVYCYFTRSTVVQLFTPFYSGAVSHKLFHARLDLSCRERADSFHRAS